VENQPIPSTMGSPAPKPLRLEEDVTVAEKTPLRSDKVLEHDEKV
jgi:hypothetical protein